MFLKARLGAKPSTFLSFFVSLFCLSLFHCLYLVRVMKRANTEVYDQFTKVKKDLKRKANCLREVETKSKVRETKAVERLTQKHERDVALAVDAATIATQMELKKVHLATPLP